MNRLPGPRAINWLVFAGCVGLMATALFFQYVMGIEPCMMCIMQRVTVVAIGLVALAGAIHNPGATGIKVYGSLIAVCALTGVAVAARQVWLQSLPPDQVPACGPGLGYLLEVFPLHEVLAKVFMGDGNCAEVKWTLFGISIPGYTLIAFLVLTGIGAFQTFRRGS